MRGGWAGSSCPLVPASYIHRSLATACTTPLPQLAVVAARATLWVVRAPVSASSSSSGDDDGGGGGQCAAGASHVPRCEREARRGEKGRGGAQSRSFDRSQCCCCCCLPFSHAQCVSVRSASVRVTTYTHQNTPCREGEEWGGDQPMLPRSEERGERSSTHVALFASSSPSPGSPSSRSRASERAGGVEWREEE